MNYTLNDIVSAVNTMNGIEILDSYEQTFMVDTDSIVGNPTKYVEQVVHCRVYDRDVANTFGDIIPSKGNPYVEVAINNVMFGTECDNDSIDVDDTYDVMLCKEKPYVDSAFNCVVHDIVCDRSAVLPDEFWFVKSTLKGK